VAVPNDDPRGSERSPEVMASAVFRAQVAINARAAARRQIGGVERMAREMARRLPELRPNRYRVLRPPRWLAHKAGHLWEQAALPLMSAGCELIYSPANLAPVASARNVVVVHDAAAVRHPGSYTPAYRVYHRALLAALVRRARLLLTVSEFSRQELVGALGADPARVRVVPEGVDERFSPAAVPLSGGAYGLDRPYVLVVGTASERKNLGVLGPAARALRARGAELVLAGSDRGYLRRGEVPLRRLGYVPDEDLPSLYAGALALVLPSRYEGFGLPCLEAMACGVPVVAAASGALPETVGSAGLLVSPQDRAGFAEAVLAAAFDEGMRARLVAAGRRRAACFPWSRTARETDAAIEEVLATAV
jgi:glycosyltransferase involved in cell wall biosynthesis